MDIHYKEFLLLLLNPNIEERCSIKEIFENSWIKKIPDLSYYAEINMNDSIKYLMELQKIEYSKFLQERNRENKYDINLDLEEYCEIYEDDDYFAEFNSENENCNC